MKKADSISEFVFENVIESLEFVALFARCWNSQSPQQFSMTTSQCSEKINFISSLNWTDACGHMQIKGPLWLPIAAMAAAFLLPLWGKSLSWPEFPQKRSLALSCIFKSPWHLALDQETLARQHRTPLLLNCSPGSGSTFQATVMSTLLPWSLLLECRTHFELCFENTLSLFHEQTEQFSSKFLPGSLVGPHRG